MCGDDGGKAPHALDVRAARLARRSSWRGALSSFHIPITTNACKTALREVTGDDLFWRTLAIDRWGPRAAGRRAELLAARAAAAAAEEGNEEGTAAATTSSSADAGTAAAAAGGGPSGAASWRAYAARRMPARAILRSPLALLQERYADPWRHIVCCVLCSRTSGSEIISSTIARFFEAFPTPSAVLDADDAAVAALIHPLGLQPVRLRAVRAVSHGFLATDFEDPTEFYGCGRFVADSWRVFTRGDLSGAGVEDRNLKAYLAWARRHRSQARAGAGGGGEAEVEEEKEEEEVVDEGAARRQRAAAAAAAPADGGARAARAARRAAGGGGDSAAAAAAAAATPDAPPSRRTRGALTAAAATPGRATRQRSALTAAAAAGASGSGKDAVPSKQRVRGAGGGSGKGSGGRRGGGIDQDAAARAGKRKQQAFGAKGSGGGGDVKRRRGVAA